MSESAALVWCPYPGPEGAEHTARTVVEERLAACANILPGVRSIFRYEGRIGDANEVGVLFKTTGANLERLMARIAELHPYEVPAIAGWHADAATPAVLAWLTESASAP